MYDEGMPLPPHRHKNFEWWVLGLIMLVAFVFRFQYIQDISTTLFGFFTVLATYLLAKRIFSWQIAAMSSFLLAISSWHVLYSFIGSEMITAQFFLVLGLYFFWRGKTSLNLLDFAASGVFVGLGMRTGPFWIMPMVLILVFMAYWHSIKQKYGHGAYEHTRNRLIRGFAMVMVVGIIVASPVLWGILIHQGDGIDPMVNTSIFASARPLQALIANIGTTLSHFGPFGDRAGSQLLLWPVSLLFILGCIHNVYKLIRRWHTHGHYPTVPILLLSWFFIGLLPSFLSAQIGSDAIQLIMVAPVVMIFAGEGLWWLYDFSRKWYGRYDAHEVVIHEHHGYEKNVVATLAVCLLLFAIMLTEYHAYFSLHP